MFIKNGYLTKTEHCFNIVVLKMTAMKPTSNLNILQDGFVAACLGECAQDFIPSMYDYVRLVGFKHERSACVTTRLD